VGTRATAKSDAVACGDTGNSKKRCRCLWGHRQQHKVFAVACVPTGNSRKSLPLPVSPQATNHIQQLIFINHFKNK